MVVKWLAVVVEMACSGSRNWLPWKQKWAVMVVKWLAVVVEMACSGSRNGLSW